MKLLELLAKTFAVLAGLLLVVITAMTCVSLVGRNTTGWSIVGAFELSGAAAGAAIAMFMPWCQVRRGNIIVDFFTAGASAATQDRLDRLGAALLAALMGLLTWRTGIGGMNAWESQTGTMIMGFPEWIVYAGMVPPLALTALIALVQAMRGFPAPALSEAEQAMQEAADRAALADEEARGAAAGGESRGAGR